MREFDPRTKLIITAIFSSSAVIMNDIISQVLLLILVVLTIKSLYISPIKLIKKLRKLLYLFIFIALIQCVFTSSGQTIFYAFDWLRITDDGVTAAITIVLRVIIIIFSGAITTTSSPGELASGLAAWKVPYEIVFMVYIGIRFLPYIKEELNDSIIAVQLTGVDIKHISIKNKLSIYTYILTPAVISALTRARQISIAAEMRGFRAYDRRSFYKRPVMRWMDFVAIGLISFITIVIIILNYMG